MKKIIFVFFCTVFLLAGCQNTSNELENNVSTTHDEEVPTPPENIGNGQENTAAPSENTGGQTPPESISNPSENTTAPSENTEGKTSPESISNGSENTAVPSENTEGKIPPETVGSPAADIDRSGFQKSMNIVSPLRLRCVCKTENGYYLQNEGLLYFLDYASGQMIAVCGKPECSHNDSDCNAWINSSFISYYDGKLYYRNADAVSDSIGTLWSMNLDGTGHTMVQRLQAEKITDPTFLQYPYQPILVNGSVYYIERNTMLYQARIGADLSEAVLLLKEDTSGKLESTWKFWADNGNVYAMNHFMNLSGEYQDVLYQLGESKSDTKEIWNSSKLSLHAVSDSYWYITGRRLYYYVSGADLWEVDLDTGASKTIVKLSDRVRSGQALFTDANAVLLDLESRMLSVYDKNGNLQCEVSIASVYEEYSDIYSCDLVFADGSSAYMLAYHGGWLSASSALYQIDWAGAGVREIKTWPAANAALPNTDQQEHIIQIDVW